MAGYFEAQNWEAQLVPGLYPGQVVAIEECQGVNMQGEDSTYLKWTFEVTHQGKTLTLTSLSSNKFSPKAKAQTWAQGILGRPFANGEKVTWEVLYRKPCQLFVDVKELDDGGSTNVVDRILVAAPATTGPVKKGRTPPPEKYGVNDVP